MMDRREAYKPSSPYWGCGVSPAAKIVPKIVSELERLREFAETFSRCPYCEELRECCPGCPHKAIAEKSRLHGWTMYQLMLAARAALWGE